MRAAESIDALCSYAAEAISNNQKIALASLQSPLISSLFNINANMPATIIVQNNSIIDIVAFDPNYYLGFRINITDGSVSNKRKIAIPGA